MRNGGRPGTIHIARPQIHIFYQLAALPNYDVPPPSFLIPHFSFLIAFERVYQPNNPLFSAGEFAIVFPCRIFIALRQIGHSLFQRP